MQTLFEAPHDGLCDAEVKTHKERPMDLMTTPQVLDRLQVCLKKLIVILGVTGLSGWNASGCPANNSNLEHETLRKALPHLMQSDHVKVVPGLHRSGRPFKSQQLNAKDTH